MLVVAVAVGALSATASGGLAGESGPRFPAAWAPAVAPLAAFVEAERGLLFDHPVEVEFLADEDFTDLVSANAELTAHGPAGDDESGAYRALGLLEGDVDLIEAGHAAAGRSVLAYYDFASRTIRVRGTELTFRLQGTLVHELTHVLQDQAFNLARQGTFASDAQNQTFRAIFEGDAARMEGAWAASLDDAGRSAYSEARRLEGKSIDLDDVPEVLTTFLWAPYQFGPLFAEVVTEAAGQAALDGALSAPPLADAQILDPFRFLGGDEVVHVARPRLAGDESETRQGAFGAITLYLMLAQRLDPHLALAAADEWAGDTYVNFTRSGRQCVRAAFAGRGRDGTDAIAVALGAWAQRMPEGSATLARRGELVELTSCDPGTAARTRNLNRLATAVTLPLARTRFALGALAAGTPAPAARCAAGNFLAALRPAEVEAWLYGGARTTAMVEAAQGAGVGCGGT